MCTGHTYYQGTGNDEFVLRRTGPPQNAKGQFGIFQMPALNNL